MRVYFILCEFGNCAFGKKKKLLLNEKQQQSGSETTKKTILLFLTCVQQNCIFQS